MKCTTEVLIVQTEESPGCDNDIVCDIAIYPGFPYSARGMMRLKMLVVAFEARFVCLQNE